MPHKIDNGATITAPNYDTLTGSVTILEGPELEEYHLAERSLVITLNAVPAISRFEIHVGMSDGSSIIKTVAAYGRTELTVDVSWSDGILETTHFVIYGFERNLCEHLGSTISIKPLSYQTQRFYVDGGFGVIGALNFMDAIQLGD